MGGGGSRIPTGHHEPPGPTRGRPLKGEIEPRPTFEARPKWVGVSHSCVGRSEVKARPRVGLALPRCLDAALAVTDWRRLVLGFRPWG
jgi:hypothetical protein